MIWDNMKLVALLLLWQNSGQVKLAQESYVTPAKKTEKILQTGTYY